MGKSCFDALIESIRYADIPNPQSTETQAVLMIVEYVLTCTPQVNMRVKVLDLALALTLSFTELLISVPQGRLLWELLTRWVEEGTLEEVYVIAEQWEEVGKVLAVGGVPEWLLPLVLRHAIALTRKCQFSSIASYFDRLEDGITPVRLRTISSEALLTHYRLHSQAGLSYSFLQVFSHLLTEDLLQRELFIFTMRAFAPAWTSSDVYLEGVKCR